MTAEVKKTGEEIELGLKWAHRGLVCSVLSFFLGACGLPAPLLLATGVLAVACGFIGLRRTLKSRSVWYPKLMAAGGIVLGCFLALVGLDALITPNRAVTKAKKVTSLATATALESAINTTYNEYGRIPNVGSSVTTDSPEGLKLLNILLGIDVKSDNSLNSRSIKFLTVKEAKNKKNGLIYSADEKSAEGLYDPWGNPYTVVLDTQYKEHLQFTMGKKAIDLKGRRSAAFSPGPDGVLGSSDDVRTW